MSNEFITFNGIQFKKYDENYYVSEDGDIYSVRSNKIMKHAINQKYHKVDLYGKHRFVHQLVYETYKGPIPEGYQINHIDDNKDNNNINNLYAGTQKQNIHDCFKNGHRVGFMKSIMVFDNKNIQILQFCPARDIIEYSGHHSSNGSVSRAIESDWFKERYDVIEFVNGKCNDY